MQEDKYPVSLEFAKKDFGDKFLLIKQGNNEVYIPYYKIKKTLAGIQYIFADMEIDNEVV